MRSLPLYSGALSTVLALVACTKGAGRPLPSDAGDACTVSCANQTDSSLQQESSVQIDSSVLTDSNAVPDSDAQVDADANADAEAGLCPPEEATLMCPGSLDQPPCLADGSAPPPVDNCPLPASPVSIRVLLFAYEDGWGPHPSHCVADAAVLDCGHQRGWQIALSRDPNDINTSNLSNFDVVVYLITGPHALGATGQDAQRAALQTFIESGHGFAGIHSITATDTGVFGAAQWPWFVGLTGATFVGHPPHPTAVKPGVVHESIPNDSLLQGIADPWVRCEEWHTVTPNPSMNSQLEVLLSLQEACTPAVADDPNLAMGVHPLAWRHVYDGGRVFITLLGHTSEAYHEPVFLNHIARGIEWAAGR